MSRQRITVSSAIRHALLSQAAARACEHERLRGLGRHRGVAAVGVGAHGLAELLVQRRAADQHDVSSRRPFAFSSSITTFMYGIVVVSSADMPEDVGLVLLERGEVVLDRRC